MNTHKHTRAHTTIGPPQPPNKDWPWSVWPKSAILSDRARTREQWFRSVQWPWPGIRSSASSPNFRSQDDQPSSRLHADEVRVPSLLCLPDCKDGHHHHPSHRLFFVVCRCRATHILTCVRQPPTPACGHLHISHLGHLHSSCECHDVCSDTRSIPCCQGIPEVCIAVAPLFVEFSVIHAGGGLVGDGLFCVRAASNGSNRSSKETSAFHTSSQLCQAPLA